jgi:hypothetical protein
MCYFICQTMSIPINSLEIKKVIEEYLRNKGYGGGTYDITIRYIPPEERVKVTVVSAGTARRAKKERIMPKTVDRQLTESEWCELYALAWPEHLKLVLDYYRQHGNEPVSTRELFSLGIKSPRGTIDHVTAFLRRNGQMFGIRKEPGRDTRHTREGNKFRIYPLAID